MTNTEPNPEPGDEPPSTRRQFLSRGMAGGAALAVAGGVVGATASAAVASDGDDTESLVIECAVLGPSIRDFPIFLMRPELELDEGDVRGSPFFAQGLLYPEGTIRGDGFIPTEEDSIGTFICRGHLLINPSWPAPHLMTHQEYYFGDLSEFPLTGDMLSSEGPEGDNKYPWESMRIVNGGTGRYRGARGQVLQRQFATNSTLDEFGQPTPCFRFEFDIDIP
jgi:hypothetical protein